MTGLADVGRAEGSRPCVVPSWTRYVASGLGVAAAVAAARWTAGHVEVDPLLRQVALFAHLGSLVVGLGAVVAVDWTALQWLVGRRTLPEVLELAGGLHLPIWLGYAGLVLTGVLLAPDPTRTLTEVKLLLVLVVGLNGVAVSALRQVLARRQDLPLLLLSAGSAALSQAAWWGAAVIGFLNRT